MSSTDGFLDHNLRHEPRRGDVPVRPSSGVAVVACMDTRLDLDAALGLGGKAHIIRNAGGLVTPDALRSLSISQCLLGTREVMIVHHTDCGLVGSEDRMLDAIERETGARPTDSLGAFSDLETQARESIAKVRESPFVPRKDSIRAFIYDVETHRVREVRLDDASADA